MPSAEEIGQWRPAKAEVAVEQARPVRAKNLNVPSISLPMMAPVPSLRAGKRQTASQVSAYFPLMARRLPLRNYRAHTSFERFAGSAHLLHDVHARSALSHLHTLSGNVPQIPQAAIHNACPLTALHLLLPMTAYTQAVSSQTSIQGPTYSRQGDYDLASYAASRWDLADASPGTLGTKFTHVDGQDLC
jgi:hypothetical protein